MLALSGISLFRTQSLGSFGAAMAAAVYCALSPSLAFSQLGLALRAELEYIENPRRISTDSSEADLLSTIAASVEWARVTERFETSLQYQASKQDYRDGLLADQDRIAGNGTLIWKLFPDRLTWHISNRRNNVLIDISEADTTDNRQILSQVSTGPTLTVPFGGVNFLSASADFSKVSFEQSQSIDQSRNNYSLSLSRLVGSRLTLSLGSNYSEADFGGFGLQNFDSLTTTASAEWNTESYNLTAGIGRNQSERIGFESDNPTYSLNATYSVNARLGLAASYSQSVQDLINEFRQFDAVDTSFQDEEFGFGDRIGDSNSDSLYLRKSKSLGATYTVDTAISLGIRYSDDVRSSLFLPFEEFDERLSSTVNFSASTRLNLGAMVEYSRLTNERRFEGERKLLRLSMNASYQLGERFQLFVRALNTDQKGEGTLRDFGGNNFAIGITYTR